MEEREKEILRTISDAYPKMTDFQKGYLLGVAESKAAEKIEMKKKQDPVAG